MTYSAEISRWPTGHRASLTVTVSPGNEATLAVNDADGLAADILSFLSNPHQKTVDHSRVGGPLAYMITPSEGGLRISTLHGFIDVPWRWLQTVAQDLG